MKKTMSTIAAAALLAPAAIHAADGVTTGEFRAFYINRAYDFNTKEDVTRDGLAAGGHLKYTTDWTEGFSTGAALYVTEKLDPKSETAGENDKTLFDENGEGYAILGEAYVQYKNGGTTAIVGRQKLNTPMAGADDARMLPTLFEAAVLVNTDVKDTTLVAAHVTKMAAGSFSNAYGSSINALTLTAGYGAGKDPGSFVSMGTEALGSTADSTSGVTAVAAVYKGLPDTTLQVWDYLAHDITNVLYVQADTKVMGLGLSGQLINESGKITAFDTEPEIGATYVAAKLSGNVGSLGLFGAFSQTGSDEDKLFNGSIVSPWGGMPAFTQGMVTRHQFFADTVAAKFGGKYTFGNGATLTLAYASFAMGDKNPYATGNSWTASEALFDFIYPVASVKGLKLRVRGNFPTDFYNEADGVDSNGNGVDDETTSWSEYRFIASYMF